MRNLVLCLSVLLLAGCSSGLQEVAFMDQGRYIVSRSLVNDRWTAGQPHPQGVFVCRQKISSEDFKKLNKDGNQHSQYLDCTPSTEYTQTTDQSVLTQYSGPMEAVVLGAALGTGFAMSGDTVIQQGGGASASAKAKSRSSAMNKRK